MGLHVPSTPQNKTTNEQVGAKRPFIPQSETYLSWFLRINYMYKVCPGLSEYG